MRTLKYACNQLFDIEKRKFGVCLVEIDSIKHTLLNIESLENIESPFTEWLGGTFILSNISTLSKTLTDNSLRKWIEYLQEANNYNKPLYIWHTRITNLDKHIENIRRL